MYPLVSVYDTRFRTRVQPFLQCNLIGSSLAARVATGPAGGSGDLDPATFEIAEVPIYLTSVEE
jgi:hypothetical protein